MDLDVVRKRLGPVVILGVPLVIGALLVSSFASATIETRAISALIFVVMVVGLYTFSGNSGVVSFGHLGFSMIAAYTSALLTIPPQMKKSLFPNMPGFLDWIIDVHLDVLPAMFVAMAVAAGFAALVGLPLMRLGGVQAAIATLAMLVIITVVIKETKDVTRGVSTMVGVPKETTLWSALIWALVVILVASLYQDSTRGMRLRASREDPQAARAVGVKIFTERWVAWVLSASIAGAGGALYGHYLATFSPINFEFRIVFLTVAMLVIGGLYSLSGAVVGVVFVSIVQEVLRRVEVNGIGPIDPGQFPGLTEVAIAAILLITMILRPNGLTGGREIALPSFRRGPAPATVSAAAEAERAAAEAAQAAARAEADAVAAEFAAREAAQRAAAVEEEAAVARAEAARAASAAGSAEGAVRRAAAAEAQAAAVRAEAADLQQQAAAAAEAARTAGQAEEAAVAEAAAVDPGGIADGDGNSDRDGDLADVPPADPDPDLDSRT
jgi:branched-chain amino acid transport system permease protein